MWVNYLESNYPGDNYPGANCPREIFQGAVVWGVITRGAIIRWAIILVRGDKYLGGNFPGGILSEWYLSGGAFVLGPSQIKGGGKV